jgi:hypothetical protein
MIYNIIDFGAICDGKTLVTKAIQKAVDACSENNGGMVYVPSGKYLCGSVVLKDNVHLYIESGAILYGAEVIDFDRDEDRGFKFYQDLSHSTYHVSMFRAENAKNITVSGYGTIDMRSIWDVNDVRGQGDPNLAGRAAKIFAIRECENVTIKDLTLLNATDIAVYLAGCTNVRIDGLTLSVHIDGISPDCCKNVMISNCNVVTGDDAIVIKSSYTLNRLQDSENITITNCVVSSRSNGIKVGTETNGGMKNLVVSNCTLQNVRGSGLALEMCDGGVMDGVCISNISMKNVANPLFMMVAPRRRGPEGTIDGKIKNVSISNVIATGPYVPYKMVHNSYLAKRLGDDIQEPWRPGVENTEGKAPEILPWQITSNITGLPNNPIENLTLRDINLQLRGGAKKGDWLTSVREFEEGDYPEANTYVRVVEDDGSPLGKITYLSYPAKGIYFRHVKGLNLDNVKVFTELDDEREEFVFDDVEDLQVK